MDKSKDRTQSREDDGEEEKKGLEKRSSPRVAAFDGSVDNFFAAMDSVSTLCGEPRAEDFDAAAIERSASMFVFLKEWSQFCDETKEVRFSYATESARVNDVVEGISLSQFSAAAVPKMESSTDKSEPSSCNDFVLNAGGPVWALDWCPRVYEKPDHPFKCEYLAVATHPPGSSYHRIGAPLVGRGAIQIWCLISLDRKELLARPSSEGRGRPRIKPDDVHEKVESAMPRSRGRPRKRHAEDECLFSSSDKETTYIPKPRGRPRKIPKMSSDDLTTKELVPARPRGRPRKDKDQGVNSSGQMSRPNECMPPENADLPEAASEVPLSGDEETIVSECRGRPRNEAVSCMTKSIPTSKEKPSPHATDFTQLTSGCGALTNVDSEEVALRSPAPVDKTTELVVAKCRGRPSKVDKEDLLVPKCRGRPRKNVIPGVNGSVSNPGVALLGDATNNGLTLSTNSCNVPVDSVLGKADLPLPVSDDASVHEEIPTLNKNIPKSGVELEADASVNGLILGADCVPSLNMDVGSAALALVTSAHLSVEKESLLNSARGRPRQSELPRFDKNAPSSGVQGQNMTCSNPILHTAGGGPALNVDFQIAISAGSIDEEQSVVPRRRGRPRKTTIQSVSKSVPTSGFELDADCSKLSNGEFLEPLNVDSRRASVSYPESELQDVLAVKPTGSSSCEDKIFINQDAANQRAFKANMNDSSIPEYITLPRVVLFLAHNGKVAWDMKWRPNDSCNTKGKQHIGYLAVLLGNGSLEVCEVPQPAVVRSIYLSSITEGIDPRFLELNPVFKCSKVKCGDRQCIPLTMEWSPSASHDLIIAGCHDGTVALWKFSTQCSFQDTKPLLCFMADAVPIRALAWVPEESDSESSNIVVTAGHEGLRFWDLRDPYRPLWELFPVQRSILSLDWLADPRCIIFALDDGTLRTLSLWNLANDIPVIGMTSDGAKQQPGWHTFYCSPFALWNVHVSQSTGEAAYCCADGSTYRFQVTLKSQKDARNRVPHLLCGSVIKDGEILNINTPLQSTQSLAMQHLIESSRGSPLVSVCILDAKQAEQKPVVPGHRISFFPERKKPKPKFKNLDEDMAKTIQLASGSSVATDAAKHPCRENGDDEGPESQGDFPPKIVAMHRVRWNMNKGNERWLCYGGAAGIVRCQEIT